VYTNVYIAFLKPAMIVHRVIFWPVNRHQRSISTPPSFGKHMHVFVHSLWMVLRGYSISCFEHFVLVSEICY
jgi:hypothetical protein